MTLFVMIIKRDIGEKGQVVIPKDIRDMLGLHSGSKVVFEVKDKDVFIKPEMSPEEFLKDFFNVPGKKKGTSLSLKELKKLREEQYELP
jgi:AbrB family looped-hinge helix DNA binding protein